jgi:prepilin-type processing-associated H-X9-DG protein
MPGVAAKHHCNFVQVLLLNRMKARSIMRPVHFAFEKPRACFIPLPRLPQRVRAFTRLDLLAILAAIGLLALIVVPAVANTKPRADRVSCLNNLRLIGRACHLWAHDHGEQMPWWVIPSEGGTRFHLLQNNAWFNFSVMSNELVTPAILACPTDPEARVAREFSTYPTGGFLNALYQNMAVSYFIGLDTFLFATASFPVPLAPAGLSGDRHLRVDAVGDPCSSGVRKTASVRSPSAVTQWTNAIHGTTGNVLLVDGRVEQTSARRVARTIHPFNYDSAGVVHLLMPR